MSEVTSEKIFRDFYGTYTFLEKTEIPTSYGFKSKKHTNESGYPDFFLDGEQYAIVVEAKPKNHTAAQEETKFYMLENKIKKDIIGIAFSGQSKKSLKVSYFFVSSAKDKIETLNIKNNFITLNDIEKEYYKHLRGDLTTTENLIKTLKELNKRFNYQNRIRDTKRSLFFSGLMIALKNNNFRNTYQAIQPPSKDEISSTQATVLEAHYLNKSILEAITNELNSKKNNLSKEISWYDEFGFIKNVDFPLSEYKEIIDTIKEKIYYPFQNKEKQDVLGRAYKIFLSRAGKADNKNIILTPDHIKTLMVDLARLSRDDVVLDTCTGSGGFLMEAMEQMLLLADGDPERIKNIQDNQLIGFEVDSVLFALACSNMFLHGDGRSNLLYRSSLLETNESGFVNNNDEILFNYIKSKKPRKAIINPPYEDNNSIKFTKQALEYLEANGKLIIIMPTPTLTHNQNGLTEEILKIAKLDFVIKMPNKLFSEQNRTVNTSIFGFTKTPHNENDDVLFYNLEDDGFVSVQHKGRIDKNNKWETIRKQVKECIFNSIELEKYCEKRKIYKNGILNCAGYKLRKERNRESVKIGTLFDIVPGALASENGIPGKYPFITAGEEWKTHTEYTNDEEAIIFAAKASGSLGRTHYFNGKFAVSNLCFVLTSKNNKKYPINLQFYNYYFKAIQKQIVSDLSEGTSKLVIQRDALLEYYIDYIPIDEQNNFINEKVKKHLAIEKKYQKSKCAIEIEVKNLA